MEFTVSKSDLVRELSLSQGVVEKKTTIPILSNVLIEASGDRITLTATAVPHRIHYIVACSAAGGSLSPLWLKEWAHIPMFLESCHSEPFAAADDNAVCFVKLFVRL